MRHAAVTNRKNRQHADERDQDKDGREHTIASASYRQAKQRGFFLNGEDVLKSLDAESDLDEAYEDAPPSHGHH